MDGLGAPLREGAPSKEAENTRATAQCKRRAGLSSGGGAGVGLAEQAEQALAQPGIRGVLALAAAGLEQQGPELLAIEDRKSTRLNSSHVAISYAVFCLKKKKKRDELVGG